MDVGSLNSFQKPTALKQLRHQRRLAWIWQWCLIFRLYACPSKKTGMNLAMMPDLLPVIQACWGIKEDLHEFGNDAWPSACHFVIQACTLFIDKLDSLYVKLSPFSGHGDCLAKNFLLRHAALDMKMLVIHAVGIGCHEPVACSWSLLLCHLYMFICLSFYHPVFKW